MNGRLCLLREYDKFCCKALYSRIKIPLFMVDNDFVKKMWNEVPYTFKELLYRAGLSDNEVACIQDFCTGEQKLSSCRETLMKFFEQLTTDYEMLDEMLDLRKNNDVCLLVLEDVPRDIKDRLIEVNATTATTLLMFILESNARPYGISARSMYKLFESIKVASGRYDVAYLRRCYEANSKDIRKYEKRPDIDFYQGIMTEDLVILYTISIKTDIYNLNNAIAIVHAFRRFVDTGLVDKLLNCFGNIIPADVKDFTRSMLMVDDYISQNKGMRLSQFESLVIRSAYYVQQILNSQRLLSLIEQTDYGKDVLSYERLSEEKQKILKSRLPHMTHWEFQEYLRRNNRMPVDITCIELDLLYSSFVPDKMFRYSKWFKTFVTKKGDFPVYILS